MKILTILLLLVGIAGAQSTDYPGSVEAFHQKRLTRLTSEDGYLSLVGLHWLSLKSSEIPGFGVASLKDDHVRFEIPTESGESVVTELLLDLPEGKQRLRSGTRSLYVIKRGDRVGLRVKDSQSETRVRFSGVPRFQVDPAWRIPGRLVPEQKELSVDSVVGVATQETSPGWAEFSHQGKSYRVRLLGQPEDQEFFLVFSDRTAGKTTYPACRFLYVEREEGNKLVLDFNKSINPACAFTHFATCPLPPDENVLDFAVQAGEKKP